MKQNYQLILELLSANPNLLDNASWSLLSQKLGVSDNEKNQQASKQQTKQQSNHRQKPLTITVFSVKPYEISDYSDPNIDFVTLEVPLNASTVHLAKGSDGVCIFVNDSCDEQVVEALADMNIKLVALRCAGYNNVAIEACQANGIDVVRVPEYSPHAVAEHSVALMLMLNRRLHQAYLRNRTGQFTLSGLVGFDMHNKRVGVVGAGKIGQCVIDILLGFGCKVLVSDPQISEGFQTKYKENSNVQITSLNTLIERSDIITLHAPLNSQTYHMISMDQIASMRDGVMLINTSRGGLIDTKALISGLKSGKIQCAGLDVYEEEAGVFFEDKSQGVIEDDVLARLLTFNNVVITSHQAFLTNEALQNIRDCTVANILEFAEGKSGEQLTNQVK